VWTLANAVGTLWETWDITLNGASRFSRSAPTHEYGHFLMCDLVFRADPGALVSYYGEYMSSAIFHGGRDEASLVGEPIADFFASQVSGGLSYMAPQATSGALVGRYFYCDAAPASTPWCLEDNVGGPSQQVRFDANGDGDFDDTHDVPADLQAMMTVATLLTDAFDGHRRAGDVPNDGSAWDFGDHYPVHATPARGLDHGDESVALPGASYARIFERLTDESLHLARAPFYRALARTMLERGYARDDVCAVFALHAPNGACDALVDLDALEGAAPIAPLGLVVALQPPARAEVGAGAHLSWNDASPEADGYEVAVVDGARRVASASLRYARRSVFRTPPLPFDRPLAFEVRTRSGYELGPAARVWAWTPAEPVTSVEARASGARAIHVAWSEVDATRYVVRWRNTRTGEADEQVVEATELDIAVPSEGAYAVEVISMNALGERTLFPSPETTTLVVTPR
jgi:hypothetical protein